MVPEWKTNFLYFSDLLPSKYPIFWRNLAEILQQAEINYNFLPHTKDIWCRDYMPVQIDKNEFIQFKYDPDYLKGYEHLRTNPMPVNSYLGISVKYSDLVIDGGNIIFSKDSIILTDKVFKENNSYSKRNLVEKLSKLLKTEKIYFIPRQPYDIYGHADGMVRFISCNTIIFNDFSRESKRFREKLEKALKNLPFRIIFLKIPFEHKLSWCYLNYIQVENNIILPAINHLKEEKIFYQFEEIFKKCKIWTVPSKAILVKGGGLHCISWNRSIFQ